MQTNLNLHLKGGEVCIKARSPAASLAFIGQVTKHTTVKWSILWKLVFYAKGKELSMGKGRHTHDKLP